MNRSVALGVVILSLALFGAKPGGVENAQLWLRADIGVSASPVSEWQDYSANGWDAEQNNSLYQPTFSKNIVNFNPALYFTDHFLDVLYHQELNGANLTVFTVVLSDDNAWWRSPWTTRDDWPQRGHILYLENGNNYYGYWNGKGRRWDVLDSDVKATGSFEIATTRAEDAGGGTYINKKIYVHGLERASKNNVSFSPNTSKHFRIGKGATEKDEGAYPWHGYIAETVVFNAVLDDTQRNRVESYLALKYGITLDQSSGGLDYRDCSGRIVWRASGNSGYGNDIAGLSLDTGSSCSNLDQRVSHSINADAVITMATNKDFSSANPGSRIALSSNHSFLVWSNNNGTKEWSRSGAPMGGEILERKWKVQKSGTTGSVFLQVDVDDSDFDIDDFDGKLYFVQGDDLSTAIPKPMIDDGNGKWHIENLTFEDGELFGFVTHVPELYVRKRSCVVDDPVNGTATPKRIPGAKLRYSIEVENRGSAKATDVIVDDNVDSRFYDESTIGNIRIASSACDCNNPTNTTSNGADGSTTGENPVKLDFDTVEANSTECGYFEVELQ